jgi:hypothetical protein
MATQLLFPTLLAPESCSLGVSTVVLDSTKPDPLSRLFSFWCKKRGVKRQLSFIIAVMSFPVFSQSCDLSGVWKHSEKEVSLMVDTKLKTIRVKHHSLNAGVEGLTVVKNLAADAGQPNLWSGDIYSADTNSFVPVQLSTSDCKILLITENVETKKEILRLFR